MYEKLLRPLLFQLPPESAHRLVLAAMQAGLTGSRPRPHPALATDLFGLAFPSPVGLAAGFDKGAQAVRAAFDLGFGFVEVGTVTPWSQMGNPRPRVFRLDRDDALINRLGFNSEGHSAVVDRLERLRAGPSLPGPVGVNIGANADSEDKIPDYVLGVKRFSPLADYLTVNISSPNTKGLRDLQAAEPLRHLVQGVVNMRDSQPKRVPLLVKIAPDLTTKQIDEIVEVLRDSGVDGLIVSNTTISRPDGLRSLDRKQSGGLSGQPLAPLANKTLKAVVKALDGAMPVIGAGGVASAADVKTKQKLGASLVQLYTAMVYQGPDLPWRINRDLAEKD